MGWLIDTGYFAAALVTSPVWLTRMVRSGKVRTDWPGRFGRAAELPPPRGPRVLLHAVSVGEVNAVRNLVATLGASAPGPDVVVSVTTNTGWQRARGVFGQRVVRYPLDFSFAVQRFLDAVRPDLIALVELEVWPNFV